MKSSDTSNRDVQEAFRPTNVYVPQWMLPVLRDALYQQSEAEYRELATTPREAHHHVSLIHRRHHRSA
jgi:hypothetical protein